MGLSAAPADFSVGKEAQADVKVVPGGICLRDASKGIRMLASRKGNCRFKGESLSGW